VKRAAPNCVRPAQESARGMTAGTTGKSTARSARCAAHVGHSGRASVGAAHFAGFCFLRARLALLLLLLRAELGVRSCCLRQGARPDPDVVDRYWRTMNGPQAPARSARRTRRNCGLPPALTRQLARVKLRMARISSRNQRLLHSLAPTCGTGVPMRSGIRLPPDRSVRISRPARSAGPGRACYPARRMHVWPVPAVRVRPGA